MPLSSKSPRDQKKRYLVRHLGFIRAACPGLKQLCIAMKDMYGLQKDQMKKLPKSILEISNVGITLKDKTETDGETIKLFPLGNIILSGVDKTKPKLFGFFFNNTNGISSGVECHVIVCEKPKHAKRAANELGEIFDIIKRDGSFSSNSSSSSAGPSFTYNLVPTTRSRFPSRNSLKKQEPAESSKSPSYSGTEGQQSPSHLVLTSRSGFPSRNSLTKQEPGDRLKSPSYSGSMGQLSPSHLLKSPSYKGTKGQESPWEATWNLGKLNSNCTMEPKERSSNGCHGNCFYGEDCHGNSVHGDGFQGDGFHGDSCEGSRFHGDNECGSNDYDCEDSYLKSFHGDGCHDNDCYDDFSCEHEEVELMKGQSSKQRPSVMSYLSMSFRGMLTEGEPLTSCKEPSVMSDADYVNV